MVSLGAVGARPELELRPPVPAWTTDSTNAALSYLKHRRVRNGAWPDPCRTPGGYASTEQPARPRSEGLHAGTSVQAQQALLHREPKACTGAAPLLGSGHVRLGKPMQCAQERPGDFTSDRSHANTFYHASPIFTRPKTRSKV